MANEKKILSKAWDNRYGCGLSIELLKSCTEKTCRTICTPGPPFRRKSARGAQTAANMIQPDLFFALDASPANDMSGDKELFGRLGEGAAPHSRQNDGHAPRDERVRPDMAETYNIPYQYFASGGGTDAGRVHISNSGVPSAVIGICSRYIHTNAAIIHVDDYAAAKEMLIKLVMASDKQTVETIRENV